eukprot:5130227-Pyramimonas_sp.AAC.1
MVLCVWLLVCLVACVFVGVVVVVGFGVAVGVVAVVVVDTLPRDTLAREAPEFRNGTFYRDAVAVQSNWPKPSHDDKGSCSILPH